MSAGDVLGGRYGLRRRLDVLFGAERWLAEDDTLARPVEICVLPSNHPRAEAVLDAARQASGVADQRLVRVLDVGNEDGHTYVVTEWVDGDTLTELVRHGALAADQARTLVGETALALEQARYRGLHHLLLSSDNVLRLDDGSVKVAGLAVDAALAGLETDDAEHASRQDTFGLVAIAYAALTGFWPTSSTYHFPFELGESALPPAPDVAGSPVAPAQIVSGVPADLDTLCVQAFSGSGAPDSPGELAGQIAPWGDRVRDQASSGAFPLTLPPLRREQPPSGPAATPRPTPRQRPSPASKPAAGPPPPPVPTPSTSSTRPAATPAPTPEPPGSLPTLASADLDEAAAWGGIFAEQPREQPAPLLPATPLTRPPGTQTRTVLILVIIFVVIMLALAKCGLSGLGDNAFVERPRSTPHASSTPSGTSTPSDTPTTPADTGSAAAPVAIAGVSSFDPEGDGQEKEPLAAKAVDGNPATAWTSDAYKSATFSGLKKGVGLRLDLGRETEVHEVTITVPAPGTSLELRTVSGDSLSGSKVVASAKDLDGTVPVKLGTPVSTRYLVLWFTTAVKDQDGYRVAVSEVTVS
ncbi:MAG TPA: hypothetical protein VFL94_05780 [Actinomycetales bacterium]|nr:hypothetical protein [Actinomycetales bacterium]